MERHHVLPRRFGGSDGDENLVTLCASCHEAVESIYDKRFWVAVGLRPSDGEETVTEYVERCLSIDHSHGPVPKAQLYGEYRDWCEAGEVEPVSQHKFTKEIERLEGVASEKTYVEGEQCRCYTGVAKRLLVD